LIAGAQRVERQKGGKRTGWPPSFLEESLEQRRLPSWDGRFLVLRRDVLVTLKPVVSYVKKVMQNN
jgi:hypothetical protein